MWVDESGGTDVTDTTGTSDEMTVTVEGEEYSAEINFDIDDDGVEDTALIEHPDGGGQAFIDVDGDGSADEYIAVDSDGDVVAHAEYDEASGDWVSVPGGADQEPGGSDTQTGAGGMITADLPDGEFEVGPATVDTDDDGVNDTAVVDVGDGDTMAFTDEDGDGEADVAVMIDSQGNATVYEHTGDGEWTETPGADAPGSLWGGGPEPVEGVARIDSVTGQWISQN